MQRKTFAQNSFHSLHVHVHMHAHAQAHARMHAHTQFPPCFCSSIIHAVYVPLSVLTQLIVAQRYLMMVGEFSALFQQCNTYILTHLQCITLGWTKSESLHSLNSPNLFAWSPPPHLWKVIISGNPPETINQSEAHILWQRKQQNNQQAVEVLEVQYFLSTTIGGKITALNTRPLYS